ncbi:MAG: DUF4956 domain-containing protein [Bacteroidota bacterium]
MAIFDELWLAIILRFLLNLVVAVIVARILYFPRNKGNVEYLFTYISISVIIFLVCIMLSKVPVELGFALGLFAVFSIIRFRSIQATPRELAYLFICLGLALMNALSAMDTPIMRLIINNLLILITIGIADYLLFQDKTVEKIISYDRLDLLANEKREDMKQDLKLRFGIENIKKIQVGNIDTQKNRVKLKIDIQDLQDHHFQE